MPQGVDMQLINEEALFVQHIAIRGRFQSWKAVVILGKDKSWIQNLKRSSRARSARSEAPWARKCGNLPVREILTIT